MDGFIEMVRRVPEHAEPIAPAMVNQLATLLDADLSVLYRPSRLQSGWNLDLFAASGDEPQGYRHALASYLSSAPNRFVLLYDPARPRPEHRNRVVVINPRRAPPDYHRAPMVTGLMTDLGLAHHCQNRVLVCDGPELLAWVGGFREAPFRPVHSEVLRALAGPLRARLKLERQLAIGERDRRALFAALDAMETPAFLMTGDRIEHANPPGRARLDREPDSTRQELVRAPGSSDPTCLEVTGAGLPPLRVVLLRPSGRSSEAQLTNLHLEWGLSPRQLAVLRLVADGETNKGIAGKLGCAEVTVEYHLTALFRKSGTRTRGELTARFWAGR